MSRADGSGYVSRSGTGTPSNSKARRCVGVGVAKSSNSRAVPVVVRTVLRVKVARWSSRARNDRTSAPVRVRLLAALAFASLERTAGATGLARFGGASSVKVRGANVSRRCQTR